MIEHYLIIIQRACKDLERMKTAKLENIGKIWILVLLKKIERGKTEINNYESFASLMETHKG